MKKEENFLLGSVSIVSHMCSFVLTIYNCTMATSPKDCPPTLLRIFRGQSFVNNNILSLDIVIVINP
uniref:Uncharacterized protein n=1 Tax=Cucumis melo TaxID=3656 RepID=A0A9I9EET4_CUCME